MPENILPLLYVAVGMVIGAVLGSIKAGGIKESVFGQIFCDINGEVSSTRIMSILGVLGGMGLLGANLEDPTKLEDLAVPISVLFGGAFGGKAMQRHFEKRKPPE